MDMVVDLISNAANFLKKSPITPLPILNSLTNYSKTYSTREPIVANVSIVTLVIIEYS